MQSARSALTQLGLPYAQDAGITRHIAAFLSRQNQDEQAEFVKPNKVLFNGGVLKSELISERLLGIINSMVGDKSQYTHN